MPLKMGLKLNSFSCDVQQLENKYSEQGKNDPICMEQLKELLLSVKLPNARFKEQAHIHMYTKKVVVNSEIIKLIWQ